MRRREFIAGIGGAAWSVGLRKARAQQPAIPVIGYLSVGSPIANYLAGFRKGLSDQGFTEDRNLVIEFRASER
jgi:putative tryptophan/tyrosine transport system substrate-binding protein